MALTSFGTGECYGQASGPSEPAAIEPVTITSVRPRVELLSDRKVYNVGADLQGTSGNATDVLQAIPSVEVDSEGVVSLRGDTNVLILVNGRPMAQLSGPLAGVGLQQIPAQDVERIELITEPPAEFKAQGASGVINIITRKSHRAGLSGTMNASVGNDRRYVAGGGADYGSGDLHVSGSASLRQDERLRQIISDPSVPGPVANSVVQSSNVLDETVRRRVPVFKLGLEYAFNDTQSVEIAATRGGRTGQRRFVEESHSVLEPNTLQGMSDRRSVGQEWSMDTDRRVVFEQKFSEPNEVLSFTLHRSTFHEREHYDYTNVYYYPPASESYDDLNLSEDQVSNELAFDYTLPLSRGRKAKLGYNFQGDDNRYGNGADSVDPLTGVRIVNLAATNDFRYLQRVDAIYGSYSATGEQWNWTSGLRLERTHADIRQITDSVATQRSFYQAFPHFHLERALDESSNMSLGISRRVTRPDASYLNPYVDRQDRQNLRGGNPYLRPQDTWLIELGCNIEAKAINYGVILYFRRNHDSVTDVSQPLSPDVVLTTKENLPKADFAGLEFIGNGHMGKQFAYGVSGDLFYSQIDASGLGTSGLKSTVGVNAKAHVDYHPSEVDTLQLAASRSDKRLTPQGEVAAINLVNAGYRHQIRSNFLVVMTVSDVFGGTTYRRTLATSYFSDIYQRHIAGRIVNLGFVYHFGEQEKGKASSFEYEQ